MHSHARLKLHCLHLLVRALLKTYFFTIDILGGVLKEHLSICAPSLPRGRSIVTSLMLMSVAYVHPGECELLHICFFLMHLTAIIYVHCMVDRTSMYLYIYTSIEVHLYIAYILRASGVRGIKIERRFRNGLRENSARSDRVTQILVPMVLVN